jgi:molybdopterin-guanine dinucleotide biosynthesis protein B
MMHELRGAPETLTVLLTVFRLRPGAGRGLSTRHRLEVYRPALGKPLLHPHDRHIVAVASDGDVATDLPRLDLNEPQAIARFICDFLESHHEFTPATP